MAMNLVNKKPPASFETERLVIQKHEPADAEQLFEAARESITEVFPFLPWCHPNYKINESRFWLAHVAGQWKTSDVHAFAIRNKLTGKFLGGCGLNNIDANPVANLGYWVRSSEIGKGYATEATKSLIEYGFSHLGLLRIEIIMSVKNLASKLVAENAGGCFEGTLKNRLLLHREAHDAYLYAVTPKIIT